MDPRTARPASIQRPDRRESPASKAAWRLFLAVPLPPAVRDLVAELTGELGRLDWPVRWVNPDAAHLTLHFLGDTPPERAELLRLALPPAIAAQPRFSLRTSGLGVFPNQRRPRVIWLGLYGPTHRLAALHDAIGEQLQALDFPLQDDQPFSPHITLGRMRNTGTPAVALRDLPDLVRELLQRRGLDAPGAPAARPVPVTDVHLIRSHLGRTGPSYETLATYPLGAPER